MELEDKAKKRNGSEKPREGRGDRPRENRDNDPLRMRPHEESKETMQ